MPRKSRKKMTKPKTNYRPGMDTRDAVYPWGPRFTPGAQKPRKK